MFAISDQQDDNTSEDFNKDENGLFKRNKSPTGINEVKIEEITSFFLTYCTAPFERLINTSMWKQNVRMRKLRYRDHDVQISLETVKIELREWLISDYMNYFRKMNPLFRAFNSYHYKEIYLDFEKSVFVIMELLFFQFKSVHELKEFLKICYLVCNRQSGKMNCVLLKGDSNAGKSLFIDALSVFFLNIGRICSPSKQEKYPFQDCVDRRIIIWDDAKLDPNYYYRVKSILSGDAITVSVKHKQDGDVSNTPIFVTSDNDVFPSTDAFSNRVYTYKWRQCDLLIKYIGKNICPRALGYTLCWAANDKCCTSYNTINKVIRDVKIEDKLRLDMIIDNFDTNSHL